MDGKRKKSKRNNFKRTKKSTSTFGTSRKPKNDRRDEYQRKYRSALNSTEGIVQEEISSDTGDVESDVGDSPLKKRRLSDHDEITQPETPEITKCVQSISLFLHRIHAFVL